METTPPRPREWYLKNRVGEAASRRLYHLFRLTREGEDPFRDLARGETFRAADYRPPDGNGWTGLHHLARDGRAENVAAVKRTLAAGENFTAGDLTGPGGLYRQNARITPIQLGAVHGYLTPLLDVLPETQRRTLSLDHLRAGLTPDLRAEVLHGNSSTEATSRLQELNRLGLVTNEKTLKTWYGDCPERLRTPAVKKEVARFHSRFSRTRATREARGPGRQRLDSGR